MLLEKLQNDLKEARLQGNKDKINVLSSVIGEAISKTKRKENRDPNDEEIISVLFSFLKGVDETLTIMTKNSVDELSKKKWLIEKEIISSYLPKLMTKEELEVIIVDYLKDFNPEIHKNKPGFVMKKLNDSYKGQFDSKLAISLIN